MKRVGLLILFLLAIDMFSFAYAQDTPGNLLTDPKEIADVVEDISGKGVLNSSTGQFVKSNAEERIDDVNDWLDKNASWLSFLFRAQPAVSMLFAVNIYLILFFLALFVFNATTTWFFISDEKISLLFGSALFVILLVTNLYVNLAQLLTNLLTIIWEEVLPAGIWGALIAIIIVIVALFLFSESIVIVFKLIGKYWSDRKKAKAEREEATNREALGEFVEGVTQN